MHEESRGGSCELVAFRGRYCARLLAGSHTIFHRILFPRDTLNFFPSPSITFAKKWFIDSFENDARSFIELNSPWEYVTMIQYLSTIANNFPSFVWKEYIVCIYTYIYFYSSFLNLCKKWFYILAHLFMLLYFTIRILEIAWDFYMLIYFFLYINLIPAYACSRLLWNI